ncbi:hypothetical protein A1OE_1095 [Candidatus Endolissoclinum faulkneri L2]|uniref:Uncharacterized protein n=1 Tax=Candidatus Endolissoclinum faulkneri L2 TaxID=1193729 RepID=K7Z5E5_9PROT|nr:hypothetical protein A1OE_1095 [Candidatus Endolissoclinum faulkneri L2]
MSDFLKLSNLDHQLLFVKFSSVIMENFKLKFPAMLRALNLI